MPSLRLSLRLAGLLVWFLVPCARGEPPREKAEPARASAKPERFDQYGDPLPPGAHARMGTVRFRHAGPIMNLAFSPDGSILASSSGDNRIHLWEFASGRELRQLTVEIQREHATLVFSPDGKNLAMAYGDQKFHLWDVETGKPDEKFPNLNYLVQTLSFSPDGKLLATGGSNASVQLWDMASGSVSRQFPWKQAPAAVKSGAAPAWGLQILLEYFLGEPQFFTHSVVFAPDGKSLAAAGQDIQGNQGKIRIWETTAGKVLREWAVSGEMTGRLVYSPDGKLLAMADENTEAIHLWEAATGKELRQVQAGEGAIFFAFAPDGKTLAVTSTADSLRLIEVATGKELRRLATTEQNIQTVAFSPDGKVLASGGANHAIQLWETDTGRPIVPHDGHQGGIRAVAFPPAGGLLCSVASDRTVRRWDLATGKELRQLAVAKTDKETSFLASAVFSPDGKSLALASSKSDPLNGQMQGTISICDTATGKELRNISLPGCAISSVDFSPRGRTLAAGGGDGSIHLWDLSSGKEIRQLQLRRPQDPNLKRDEMFFSLSLVFAADGKTLAVKLAAEADRRERDFPQQNDNPEVRSAIHIWEIATGKERRKFPLGDAQAEPPLDFSALHRLRSGEAPSFLNAPIALSPNGRALALGNGTSIVLYDPANGKELRRLGGAQAETRVLAFSPGGKLLAAGMVDGTIHLWETANGSPVCRMAGHPCTITTLVFAPDGNTLASGAEDTTVLLWDLAGLLQEGLAPADAALSPVQLEALWADLAGANAVKAGSAISTLESVPQQAVPFLDKMLKPLAASVDPRRIDKLIAELDSNHFTAREQAMQELEKLELSAEPILRKALANRQLSLEVRRRLDRLLEKLDGQVVAPDLLCAHRAVEVLERIGTPEARRTLEVLAGGVPGSRLTQDAQAALENLKKRANLP